MEIEIAVPIDRLSAADIIQIRTDIAAAGAAPLPKYSAAGLRVQQLIQNAGRIGYGQIVPPANGFRVDADHDDRVKTNAWPPFEGGGDSIIEIVMDPPAADAVAFNQTLNHIRTWVNTLMLNTNNLTRRWVNGLPGNISVGPLQYAAGGGHPALGPRPKQLNHNLKGSCQVNIGIDLREYHSMLKWFASSRAARSHNETDPAAQAIYRQSKDDIRAAVNIGRQLINQYSAAMTPLQRSNMGNLRGLRGWITHMVLYIKRGTIAGGMAGTPKNLAPALLKSPPAIAAQYGMTAAESAHFNAHRNAIVDDILQAVGRAGHMGAPLATVNIFTNTPGDTLDDLSDLAGMVVPLTGGPLNNPTGVGAARTGNAVVGALPNVAPAVGVFGGGAGTRGGVVTEFRNIPGYYEGVQAWRALGLQFLAAATQRNQRNGIRP